MSDSSLKGTVLACKITVVRVTNNFVHLYQQILQIIFCDYIG